MLRQTRAPFLPLITAVVSAVTLTGHGSGAHAAESRWVADQLLVRAHSTARSLAPAQLAGEGTWTDSEIPALGVVVVNTPPGRGASVERNLRASGLFRFVERNYVATSDTTAPNDPLYSAQWGLPITHVPEAWDTTTGAGITIAVVDTGIDAAHPDLAGRVIDAYNAITGSADAADDNGHGTGMAGIAAATGFNGLGVIGVAPGADVMAVKAMSASGYGTYADIARGIVYAADHGARVINLSLGGDVGSSTLSDAVAYAVSRGVVLTAAAGNSGAAAPTYPAAYPEVIAVAATDSQDVRADFSNFGFWLSVAAPGVDVTTTDLGGGYANFSGTSPAAPFAAGAAALVLAVNPHLDASQVRSLLALTSDDLGAPGFDEYFGWGRLNVARAVAHAIELAQTTDTQPPAASVTVPQDGATVEGIVALTAAVSDNIAVTRVEYTVDGIVVAAAVQEPFSASWDSTLAAAGPHLLGATAYDASGNAGVAAPVVVTIAGAQATCSTPGVSCIPGGGAPRADCFAEWLVVNDGATPPMDGTRNVVTCVDGAPCDRDGIADGACTFDVGICFSVSDSRLLDSSGQPACQPVELSRLKWLPDAKHRRRRQPAANVANTTMMLTAVGALSGARSTGVCVSGARGLSCSTSGDCDSAAGMNDGDCALDEISLSGAVGPSERCTAIQALHVPLRQRRSGPRSGTQTLKAVTFAAPTGTRAPLKDPDTLRLVCLPAY
jgi:subtilisin family serine protease